MQKAPERGLFLYIHLFFHSDLFGNLHVLTGVNETIMEVFDITGFADILTIE